MAVTAHPGTAAAAAALRLSYFAAAIVALSLDYISSEVSFRASEERLVALTNAVMYGNIDESAELERMRLATALVQKYSPSGEATARTIEFGIRQDLKKIPAEIIAEFVVKNTKPEDLFQTAKRLEHLVE